ISPQNVMISYDGAVKLFDFGIAKAKSASEATRAGVIKGKPSYLSPEQINGEELDGRCDIFALGIVLWELLTAKRLFVAETDMGVLRLIQSAKIEPPSTFNPAVPQSLDAIVLKGLTRDKNKRYQSSEEFQRDLHKFLYSFNPSFNPADLSYYAQELFKNEIREDRDRLQKYLAIDPIDDGRADVGPGGDRPAATGSSKNKLSTKLADGLISTTDFNREMMDIVAQQQTGSLNKPSSLELVSNDKMPQPKTASVPPPSNSPAGTGTGTKPPVPANKGSGLIMAPTGGAAKNTSTKVPTSGAMPAPKRSSPTDSMVIPPWSKTGSGSGNTPRPGARTRTDLRRELTGSITKETRASGRNMVALIAVVAVGMIFVARQYGMLCGTPLEALGTGCGRNLASQNKPNSADGSRTSGGTDTASSPDASVKPAAVPEAVILLKTRLTDFSVYVNGRPSVVNNGQFKVPLHEQLKIEVKSRGYQAQRFVVPSLDKAGTYGYDVPAIAVPTGTLNYSTLPSANVVLYLGDEKVHEGLTPVRDQFPAGKYRVHIENTLLGIKADDEVLVEEGKVTRVEKTLEVKK
ncbi:MAG TPA: protein kinase, partial [Bdellovibrionota bacterium]